MAYTPAAEIKWSAILPPVGPSSISYGDRKGPHASATRASREASRELSPLPSLPPRLENSVSRTPVPGGRGRGEQAQSARGLGRSTLLDPGARAGVRCRVPDDPRRPGTGRRGNIKSFLHGWRARGVRHGRGRMVGRGQLLACVVSRGTAAAVDVAPRHENGRHGVAISRKLRSRLPARGLFWLRRGRRAGGGWAAAAVLGVECGCARRLHRARAIPHPSSPGWACGTITTK